MTTTHAHSIIQALADGQNPILNVPLREDDICQHPKVVRALYTAALALAATPGSALRSKSPKPKPAKAGQPWSNQEDQRLCEAFDADTSIAGIARNHERTPGAIRSRLVHLGKIAL